VCLLVAERLHNEQRINVMLNYIITFFVLAVLAAFLGFGGLAGAFSQIAQFVALVFVLLLVATILFHATKGDKGIPPV